jgi:hypothetical protein
MLSGADEVPISPNIDQSEKSFWDWRDWVESTVVPAFGNCVIPIYKSKNSLFYSERSGVLLQVHNKRFLLTADHELDDWEEHGFAPYTSPNRGWDTPLPIQITKPIRPLPQFAEDIDIAVFELADETADALQAGWRRFLTVNELCTHRVLTDGFYLVVGYPTPEIKEVGVVHDIPAAVAKRYWHITTHFLGSIDALVRFRKEFSFALEYGPRSVDGDGNEFKAIHVGGMSGCAVFRLTKSLVLDQVLPDVQCVGIQCAFVPRSHLKGTFITYALDAIRFAYPELAVYTKTEISSDDKPMHPSGGSAAS